MPIVIASNNLHKIFEIQSILPEFKLLSLNDIGLKIKIEETANSFHENSLIKAKAVRPFYSEIIIADDSGLSVDILNGEPGVHSARYAGIDANDAQNRKKLIEKLKSVAIKQAKAQFITVITCLINDKIHQSTGFLKGHVIDEERGENGFGYDSMFVADGYTKTLAEMNENEKNAISHRYKALESLKIFLSEQKIEEF